MNSICEIPLFANSFNIAISKPNSEFTFLYQAPPLHQNEQSDAMVVCKIVMPFEVALRFSDHVISLSQKVKNE